MGWVERGPETVIRALLNMIRPENTLVMSTMTHRLEPYDPYVTTTINMGKIADLFWRRPDARRSDHPNSSFAAEGHGEGRKNDFSNPTLTILDLLPPEAMPKVEKMSFQIKG